MFTKRLLLAAAVSLLAMFLTGPSFGQVSEIIDAAEVQSTNGSTYLTCEISSLNLQGEVRYSIPVAQGPTVVYHLWGTGSGRCTDNPSGTWDNVSLSFDTDYDRQLTDRPQMGTACTADGPDADRVSNTGYLTVTSSNSARSFSTVAEVALKTSRPLISYRRYEFEMHADSGHAGNLFVSTPSPAIIPLATDPYMIDSDNVDAILANPPTTGFGCTRTFPSSLRVWGHFERPAAATGLPAIGYDETMVARDRAPEPPLTIAPIDNAAESVAPLPPDVGGELIDEEKAVELMEALSFLTNVPFMQKIGPQLENPSYAIHVTYRNVAGGTTSFTSRGIFGLDMPVSIPNMNNAGVAELVYVHIGPRADDAKSYYVEFRRQDLPVCRQLPADIKVEINANYIAGWNPAGQVTPAASLGYQVLGLATEGMPKVFRATYSEPSDGQEQVRIESAPSCGSGRPLRVVGNFSDAAVRSDLGLVIDLFHTSSTTTVLEVTQDERDDGPSRLDYSANNIVDRISLAGVFESKWFSISLRNLGGHFEVCTHDGNQCNVPWRKRWASRSSLLFSSTNLTNSAYWPITLDLDMTTTLGNRETRLQMTNVQASRFAVDTKLDFPKLDGLLFHDDAYPFWLFMDTRGESMSGTFDRRKYENGNQKKYFRIVSPTPGLHAWNRLFVLRKKWYGPKLYDYGRLACPSGFEYRQNGLNKLLENEFASYACNSVFSPLGL